MPGNRLRFGVLSTARITNAQIRAMELSDNTELVAVASRDPGRAHEWAQQKGVPHAFGSYEEMLASDVIDAVYVPLPNGLHKEWSIKAMEQGKHVLCEKPLAANAAEVREMIAASEANGVKLMEAFMYRFHPKMERMMQLLARGAIGEVKIIHATFGFRLDRPNDVRWSTELAGGALMDVGCYCVNVASMIAGREPVQVSGSQVTAPSGVDESFAGTLEFAGGLLAAIDCSFRTGEKSQQALSISGTNGRMIIDQPFRSDEEPCTILIDKAADSDKPGPFEQVEVPGAYHYHLMVEHFADAVLNDRPLVYTPQNSLGNMRTIDALKESARTGRSITLQQQ